MKTQRLLAALFIVLLLPCMVFGEIYGWVDENGVKHYSNSPPPEGVEVISRDTEIRTEVTPIEKELESSPADLKEKEEEPPKSEAPSEQADQAPAEATGSDTVVTEEDERAIFHRERIKQRTRENTSPAPSLQNQQRSGSSQGGSRSQ